MKNAFAFLLVLSLLSSCINYKTDPPPEPTYYYRANYEYMIDAGTHSTKVYGVVSRDTVPNRGLEWVPPTDAFKVNGTALNSSNGEYNWLENAYVDGNVIFDAPGKTHFDHFFNAADSLFNRLPVGTDTIHLSNYYIDIGTDSILPDEYLILFITQGASSGKVYFNYDQATGIYRSGLSQGDGLVIGPATVQLSRRRHFDPTSIVGGTTLHCCYECRSEFVNVVIYP